MTTLNFDQLLHGIVDLIIQLKLKEIEHKPFTLSGLVQKLDSLEWNNAYHSLNSIFGKLVGTLPEQRKFGSSKIQITFKLVSN